MNCQRLVIVIATNLLCYLLTIFFFVEDVRRGDIYFFKLVQFGARLLRGTEDVSLEEPRRSLGSLELHVRSGGYSKDIVEFFETPLLAKVSIRRSQSLTSSVYLCFREPEPDHDERQSIEASIEAKGTLRLHGRQHAWER